ncbi:hypothetical protein EUTSA_v10002347mg [Eutrema salsugineum]|uniref:DYW domain-containing protein n=1 Tax=Eutrema salsugineum TaxID=72664 RepID=V4KIG5_EUTSA|nr:hypothetical protein EUTSA_v10002347mg [Eutrema salsugineum]
MMRFWCGKLKISKPYLALATQSGSRYLTSTKSITRLVQDVTDRTWTQNPIIEQQHRTVSSSVADDVTIETFDWFCKQGKSREAVEVLEYLQNNGYEIGLNRLLRLAKLCGESEALKEAKVVHQCIVSLVDRSHVSSGNTITEMYSCCGSLDDALKIFDEMHEKNSETWCVMMRCFVNNGYGKEAIDLFTRLKQEGNKPNGEIFEEVFSAFALTGDVNEGSLRFEAMQRDYGIMPSMEHYHSVTKMLATCGHLDEALRFVEKMPMEPSVDVWETLMNLSRVHGDLELGDRCAELVQKLDATRLDKVSSAGLVTTKEEPNHRDSKQCYKLRAKDTSHPDMDTICETLKHLQSQILEMGYVMSVITGRELIKRDSKRYHCFNKGKCSCNDYW